MIPLALVTALASIVSGAVSSSSHKKTIKDLEEMRNNLRLPPALEQAENIIQERAGSGLTSYENQKNEIESQMPSTLNEMKDYLEGGGMIKAMSDLYAKNLKEKRSLEDLNDAEKRRTMDVYSQFLGTKATAEQGMMDRSDEIKFAEMGVKQAKTQDSLNYANKGAESSDIMGLLTQLLSTPGLEGWLSGLFAKNDITGLKPTTPKEATFED